jgi:signal transduction histidine kinase
VVLAWDDEPVGLQAPLWRAIAVFRFASLAYAAALLVALREDYSRPLAAWGVLAGMAAWTVLTTYAYAAPERRTRTLLAADLAVTAAALLSTAVLQYPHSTEHGVMPVTATWMAGPVLAWAVEGGLRGGTIAALVLGGCDVALRHPRAGGSYPGTSLNGPILLLLAGALVGYISRLAARAERAIQHATEIEAVSRERERLARGIHDSVLQVLALVQRRGADAGGEAAEIGRLAGEQEAALRALIAGDSQASPPSGELDLRALLALERTASVSVATPAEPVLLPADAARETAAAVRAALDNVRRHCPDGTPAWVLVEDEGGTVSVTVRDDGPGIPADRLAEAASDGRLGVSHAISGRIRELGGSATISSAPGAGTEVRLRVPRAKQMA